MEQLVFEHYLAVEQQKEVSIDWAIVESETSNYMNAIEDRFAEVGSNELKSIFFAKTKDYVENFLIYEQMYPRSQFNPWFPLLGVFKRGLLVNPADDPYLLKQINRKPKSATKSSGKNPLMFLIQGAKDRPGQFPVGETYHLQLLILDLLQDRNASLRKPLSIRQMLPFLKKRGYQFKYDYVQINITTPLKKTGLVGSTSDGFFLIRSKEELKASYCFHYHKDMSISAIMSKYRRIAPNFGIDDLEDEC
ncbi:hypothetical protein [Leptonema illini]|nr:hypothetical protein [Leptonema illini]